MATAPASHVLAEHARRLFVETMVWGIPGAVQGVLAGARRLAEEKVAPELSHKRQHVLLDIAAPLPHFQQHLIDAFGAERPRPAPSGTVTLRNSGRSLFGGGELRLVDDDTIDVEILTSRLALSMTDKASSEFTDLRSRMSVLERQEEMSADDLLRPHVLARMVLEGWRAAGLTLEQWRVLQEVIHDRFGELVVEAYHETNRWLLSEGVRPDVDLRPYIRRSQGAGGASVPVTSGFGEMSTGAAAGTTTTTTTTVLQRGGANVGIGGGGGGGVHEETRLMTRMNALGGSGSNSSGHAAAVMGRLNKLVGRYVPDFVVTAQQTVAVSPQLQTAIADAQTALARQAATTAGGERALSTPAMLEELQRRQQALKQAANTPVERATIEIVALLFQSILTEERIPAAVRVWFARLQMPVLRVAVGEPDFFATTDHPARKLIDRMGACVMGFDATAREIGDALNKEIKRIVQVIEAYPDTGRRVFQTVLTEFERFLEHYFRNENEATRKGVSLAQQVEQRETLAIQYTIELRKMLNEVPVQEGVREFLFHVWADVLAMTALKTGTSGERIKAMKRTAADLIWSASAKVSREERAEVISRLPGLLKTLRESMGEAGVSTEKQDEHIQALNDSLAAAFTARAAAIPVERLNELMARLETLEELLPDAEDVQINESLVMDLSGHESDDLDVVIDGGSMPTPAMREWARELQVGGWYMLEHRGRIEPVQLAWQGMKKQLSLFVSVQGRGTLFQQQRLASYLQAGLLVPAQDESLTVKATRSALAKLDNDPARLIR